VVADHYWKVFNSRREELSINVQFETDMICLDVPNDGIQLKDHWKIYPRYKPAVSYLELYSNFNPFLDVAGYI